jgi:hypothetical protein
VDSGRNEEKIKDLELPLERCYTALAVRLMPHEAAEI